VRVPREKMEIRQSVAGMESSKGWVVISLKGMDLDGVTSLEVNLDDVEHLQSARSEGANLFESLVKKLG